MKLQTVNVIEITESVPEQIISFKDNPKGNKEAEALFIKIAKENGALDADMESYLDDGIYTNGDPGSGMYAVALTHSS